MKNCTFYLGMVFMLLTSFITTPTSAQEDCMVDLCLILKVSNPNPDVGDLVSVNITLGNQSANDATGVAVWVTIPSSVTKISSISPGGYVAGNRVVWRGKKVNGNSSYAFLFNMEVPVGNHILTSEIVVADQLDVDSEVNNGVDQNGNGLVGSHDLDDSFDPMDEDDEDDARINTNTFSDIVNDDQEETFYQVEIPQIIVSEQEVEDTAIKPIVSSNITAYPNPTSGDLRVNITQTNEGPVELILYDQKGNYIMSKKVDQIEIGIESQSYLDMSNLVSGTYTLNVRIGDTSHVKRIILVNN